MIVSAAFHKFVVVGGVIGGFKKVSLFSFEFAAVLWSPDTACSAFLT